MLTILIVVLVVVAVLLTTALSIGLTRSQKKGGAAPVAPPGDLAALEEPAVAPAPARSRLPERLAKARNQLAGLVSSTLSRSTIEQSTWDELEEGLILADVGVSTTTSLLDDLRRRAAAREIVDPQSLLAALKDELVAVLSEGDHELVLTGDPANVWLFVGANGVGKTTSIAKVAREQLEAGRGVVMAAGDTFRAAAADQLGTWAERLGVDFVRGQEGQDPGSVVFDAVKRAASRGAELVLADTAGRVHTKTNLMEELRKVRRVADRPPGKVTEVLLVIDATTGQNGLAQARTFTEAVGVTGVVLTKLDGTAKGGIVVAVQGELGIPVKLVGVGEGPSDLVPMNPAEFVDALLG